MSEWAGPYACLNLPSVLVDKVLPLGHNFSLNVLTCSQIRTFERWARFQVLYLSIWICSCISGVFGIWVPVIHIPTVYQNVLSTLLCYMEPSCNCVSQWGECSMISDNENIGKIKNVFSDENFVMIATLSSLSHLTQCFSKMIFLCILYYLLLIVHAVK